MRRSPLLAAIAAALAAPALLAWSPVDDMATPEEGCWIDDAGTPEDTSDDTQFCRLDTWIHRADTPAGNVEAVAMEQFPTWDTNPPDTSVTGGAGGGYMGNSVLDLAAPGDPNNAATFTGTYTGALDNLAVSLYAWVPGRQADGSNHNIHLMLEYGGFSVVDQGDLEVMTTPDGESTVRIDFAVDGLAELVELFGSENGPDSTHEITLKIGSWNHGFDEAVYLYDTTEVPSGIVFNIEPENLPDYTVVSF